MGQLEKREYGSQTERSEAKFVRRSVRGLDHPVLYVPLALDTIETAGPETLEILRHSMLGKRDAILASRATAIQSFLTHISQCKNRRPSEDRTSPQTVPFLPPGY